MASVSGDFRLPTMEPSHMQRPRVTATRDITVTLLLVKLLVALAQVCHNAVGSNADESTRHRTAYASLLARAETLATCVHTRLNHMCTCDDGHAVVLPCFMDATMECATQMAHIHELSHRIDGAIQWCQSILTLFQRFGPTYAHTHTDDDGTLTPAFDIEGDVGCLLHHALCTRLHIIRLLSSKSYCERADAHCKAMEIDIQRAKVRCCVCVDFLLLFFFFLFFCVPH